MALSTALPTALTLGDPAGVGPEITMRAWQTLRGEDTPFFLIGDIDLARQCAAAAHLAAPIAITDPQEAQTHFAAALPVLHRPLSKSAQPGQPDVVNAPAIISSIETAVELTLAGKAGAVVTNPIAKSVLYNAGFSHPGHTEFLGELSQAAVDWPAPHGPIMMLSGGGLRVALVTVHIPLAKVPSALRKDNIIHTAEVVHKALQTDFAITRPRIALCGLNPHAGENGTMGEEELAFINPAAKALRAKGVDITNAQPADALFREDARAGYDAVLALYHDQGLIPVKTLDFHGGINTTLGLPFIRVSPDHGTGFSIAGKHSARPDSLIAALQAASAMSACRQSYYANTKSHA